MWLKTYSPFGGLLQILSFLLVADTWGNVEDHFPELDEILNNVEEHSLILLEKNYLIQERIGRQMMAKSAKGMSLSINLSTQSIHEDRPDQSFYHRYRSFGSTMQENPYFTGEH